MFRFLLKKNFCDIWDNLFHLLVINLIDLALLMAGVFLIHLSSSSVIFTDMFKGVLIALSVFFTNCLISTFVFAEGENVSKIADFSSPKYKLFFKNIIPSFKIGIQFGLFVSALMLISFVSIPYYFNMWLPSDGSKGNILGLAFMSVIFWFMVISALALQWFMPVRNLMKNNFLKCLKKSYILFFDNTILSVKLGIINLFELFISIFTIGMVCSFNGIMLTNTNALRLLLYKYDWYEVNPDLTKEQKSEVPWEELLEKDKNTLGPRKFKSFFFPWKE